MYLSEQDNDRLMSSIGELSAPGSHLIADHAYPSIQRNRDYSGGRASLQANGSGLLSHIADPHSWLREHGWLDHLADLDKLANTHDRSLPPIMDSQRPDAPIYWFTSARK